jgi:hypothetical protein
MPFQPPLRPWPVLASALAAAGLMLTVASCTGHITPLGPQSATRPVAGAPRPAPQRGPAQFIPQMPFHLRSPFVLDAVRVQRPARAGGCPAGSAALFGDPGQCYRKLGTPLTITSAALSSASSYPPAGRYEFMIGLPPADQPTLKAITTTAADAHAYLSITVAGRTWLLPRVLQPFTGPLEIAFPSRNQVSQLYRLLASSG